MKKLKSWIVLLAALTLWSWGGNNQSNQAASNVADTAKTTVNQPSAQPAEQPTATEDNASAEPAALDIPPYIKDILDEIKDGYVNVKCVSERSSKTDDVVKIEGIASNGEICYEANFYRVELHDYKIYVVEYLPDGNYVFKKFSSGQLGLQEASLDKTLSNATKGLSVSNSNIIFNGDKFNIYGTKSYDFVFDYDKGEFVKK
jgi:hypothetical protein